MRPLVSSLGEVASRVGGVADHGAGVLTAAGTGAGGLGVAATTGFAGGGSGGATATATAGLRSSGTSTVTVLPGSRTATRFDQGLPCSASARTSYSPGSTGIATPHAAIGSTVSSRFTMRAAVGCATVTTVLGLAGLGVGAYFLLTPGDSSGPSAALHVAPTIGGGSIAFTRSF